MMRAWVVLKMEPVTLRLNALLEEGTMQALVLQDLVSAVQVRIKNIFYDLLEKCCISYSYSDLWRRLK